MRTLLVAAGLFFTVFAGVILYFAASDPGHEYDFKFVLPIDTREMPQPITPPEVVSQGEDSGAMSVTDGRAEAGRAPSLPERPPVTFGRRQGVASEAVQQ